MGERWLCAWCGADLEPLQTGWTDMQSESGEYCPEGQAVRDWGTSPHLPVRVEAASPAALDVPAFLDSLRSPRNSLGKLALPKGHMERAVEEAWVPPAVEELDDSGDGVMIHRLSELADLIIDRLQARLTEQEDRHVRE